MQSGAHCTRLMSSPCLFRLSRSSLLCLALRIWQLYWKLLLNIFQKHKIYYWSFMIIKLFKNQDRQPSFNSISISTLNYALGFLDPSNNANKNSTSSIRTTIHFQSKSHLFFNDHHSMTDLFILNKLSTDRWQHIYLDLTNFDKYLPFLPRQGKHFNFLWLFVVTSIGK